MTMVTRFLWIASVSALALGACASTDEGVKETTNVTGDGGLITPERNLLMSDMFYGSPGNGAGQLPDKRPVDEVFDLAVAGIQVEPADATTGTAEPGGTASHYGLVRNAIAQEFYNAGNTMTYYVEDNRFVFDIETAAGVIDLEINNLMFDDPEGFDDGTRENEIIAKMWVANVYVGTSGNTALGIRDVVPLPAELGVNPSVWDVVGILDEMETDDPTTYSYLESVADSYLVTGVDEIIFPYNFVGGYGRLIATNMVQADDDSRNLDTLAIVSFEEFYDSGEIQYSHAVFGHRTPVGEIPDGGTANYTGRIVGSVLTNNSVRSLTGGAIIDVDFQTGQLDLQLNTIIREGGNSQGTTTFLDYRDMTGSTTIDDNVFSGNLVETDNGDAAGEFEGGFYGPYANEAGGTFTFGNGDQVATGAFATSQEAPGD